MLEKKIRGNSYFYEVQSYREGGKVKQRILRYFGKLDPRINPEAKHITKKSVMATYRFGDVAVLYHAAKEIGMIDLVDKYVPKRQGLSLGLELFLTVAHRLLDDKPSSANLSRWVKTTHLPLLLGFDAGRISSNTQSYLMDKLYDRDHNLDHILRISTELYERTLPFFGKEGKTFFYDITSTYFEGDSCPIAKLGYSRDDAVNKLQINIGMVVNGAYGIPLMTKVFEGNVNDAETVYEMVYYTKFVIGKKKGLLVMDRGMDSEDNIKIMDTVKYDYVVGLRSNHSFVNDIKTQTDAESDDWETFKKGDEIIKLKKFTKNIFGKRRHILLYFNPTIAKSQAENRQRRIDLAADSLKRTRNLTMKKVNDILNGVKKYFVIESKNGNISWRIDQVKINQALRHDGKFCIITNLNIKASEVYKLYFSKDKIEKGFRHMKQDAVLHPTRKRLVDRVIVDVFICHLAYLLLRVAEHLAQQKINRIFWDGLTSEAKEIRLLELQNRSGNKQFQIIPNNEIQKNIVDKLDLSRQLPVGTTKAKTSSEI